MYPYLFSVSSTLIPVRFGHTSLPFTSPPIALVTDRTVRDELHHKQLSVRQTEVFGNTQTSSAFMNHG